jgi:hypothetical protein
VRLPLGHELIHQSHKTSVVCRFEQVRHLVDDNVLEALPRLSGKIGIQSNGGRPVIAAAPFSLHSLEEEPLYPYTHQPLPFFNQRWNGTPQLAAMPSFKDCPPLRSVRALAHTKDHPPVI